jgi:hypothetical protein
MAAKVLAKRAVAAVDFLVPARSLAAKAATTVRVRAKKTAAKALAKRVAAVDFSVHAKSRAAKARAKKTAAKALAKRVAAVDFSVHAKSRAAKARAKKTAAKVPARKAVAVARCSAAAIAAPKARAAKAKTTEKGTACLPPAVEAMLATQLLMLPSLPPRSLILPQACLARSTLSTPAPWLAKLLRS